MSDTEHSIYYSYSVVFTVLEESGQTYFSCARMPGFLFSFEKDRTYLLSCLLACVDAAEDEPSKVSNLEGSFRRSGVTTRLGHAGAAPRVASRP